MFGTWLDPRHLMRLHRVRFLIRDTEGLKRFFYLATSTFFSVGHRVWFFSSQLNPKRLLQNTAEAAPKSRMTPEWRRRHLYRQLN
jgi:hypothetical protein